jgi:hypothetical protein
MAKRKRKITLEFCVPDNITRILLGILLIAAIILLPTKIADVEEEYQTAEPVTLPALEVEQYVGEECFTKTAEIKGEILMCESSPVDGSFGGITTVKIMMLGESPSGYVEIELGYVKDGVDYGAVQRKVVNSGQETIFIHNFNEVEIDDCYWKEVSAPTAEVCGTVNKTKTVVGEETKCRIVTKDQTVTKEVNWLFEFDPIIHFRE